MEGQEEPGLKVGRWILDDRVDGQRPTAAVVGRSGGHVTSPPTRRKVEYWNCCGNPVGV